jgi:hypothetical protein
MGKFFLFGVVVLRVMLWLSLCLRRFGFDPKPL